VDVTSTKSAIDQLGFSGSDFIECDHLVTTIVIDEDHERFA